MGGGGPINVQRVSALRVSEYHGGLTWQVILVAAIGASGGLLFGYDNGIIGGVMAFEQFEEKFFPDVYAKKNSPEVVNNTNPYCAYENEKLQLFASSFFLAGMVSSLFGAKVSRAFGRRITMIIGSICFIVGSVLCAFANNIAMLCVGRVFLGWGVGMVNQVAPLYLSEMAPYKYRGALNVCFQWSITIGILVAQLINYGVQDMNNGWQLSLGLAGSPALVLLIGSILLPETPNSLIERGHYEKGRKVLATVRGTQAVDAEYEDIVEAVRLAEGIRMRDSWRMLFTRRFTPQLVNTIMINMFQQFSGINAIIFYVPVLFSSLGSGKSAALLNTVIIGAVNVGSTFVSVLTVDKFGRKFLLIEGGIQTAITQLIVGVVLGVEFSAVGGNVLPKSVSIGVLVVICVYIAGFAWSWGPLGWLVPSEIFTLETRPAGTATAVFSNFLFTFIIGQTFLTMLCSMHWGVFIFFCGFLIMAVLWVIFFLPETMRLPVERVEVVFAKHWFWRKVMGPAGEDAIRRDEERMATRKAGMLETAGDYAEPGSPGPKDAASPKVGPSPGGTTVTREQ